MKCPECDCNLNTAVDPSTGVTRDLKRGDILLCTSCATPVIFKKKGLRALTEKDMSKMSAESAFTLAILRVGMMMSIAASGRKTEYSDEVNVTMAQARKAAEA